MNRAALLALAALALSAPADAARKKKEAPVAAPAPPPPTVKSGVELWRSGDYAGAVAIWQPFAANGDPDAMFNMGQAYKLGRSVPKDLGIARDYYRKAALKGHLPAQANLGILLFQAGEKPEATRWLKAAADRGEMRAQYVLGIAHWNGDGVPRSLTLAYAYLARASAQGLTEATGALDTLTGVISPLERANGWAVATSLAAGNGIPPEFAAAQGRSVAAVAPLSDPVLPNQVIKPLPRAADPERGLGNSPQPPAPPPPLLARKPPPAVTETPDRKPAAPPAQTNVPPPPVQGPPVPSAVYASNVPAVRASVPPAVAPVPAAALPPPVTAAPPVVEKPASKPVEKPALKPVVKPAEKKIIGWRVQLGAFSRKKLAEMSWEEFAAKQKKLVGSKKPIYAADGNVTKLQLGPYKTKAAAREACDAIAKLGRACFATED